MVNSAPPEYPAPPIAETAELLQQVLDHNQELRQLISVKGGESGRKNTNRNPTSSTRLCQGQPRHPMPTYFDKYCWTHGRGSHKGGNFNHKGPMYKYKYIMKSRIDERNYVCTELQCGTVPKLATNNNRNILIKYTESNLFPPNLISYKHAVLNTYCKSIILKVDTQTTRNYIRGQDTIILKSLGPTTTGPRVRLPHNSII